jgi:hypothetical protein
MGNSEYIPAMLTISNPLAYQGLFRIALLLSAFLTPSFIHAASFPSSIRIDDNLTLERVGYGTFRWTVIRVYDGAFYLSKSTVQGKEKAKRLELEYHTSISAERIVSGGNAILKRNVSQDTLLQLQDRLNLINSAYVDVRRGDRYSLTYIPGIGTELRLNDKLLVTIPGEDFAEAYFKIWLGPSPISDTFRDTLLGKK